MKICVTGGAGFIGSNLADKMLNQDNEVIVVDDFNDYYPVEYKEQNVAPNLSRSNYHLYRADINNQAKLTEIFARHQPEKIIHLAARAGVRPSIQNPAQFLQANIAGTLNLLELCRQFAIKDFIFASSSSVYGNNAKVPFCESDSVDCPISPYAATKKACELIAHTYHHLYGLNCVGLRLFTVYGERGRPDMAPYLFTQKIHNGEPIKRFGDGTSRRDYTYIDDIISGIMSCLDKNFGYEIINLGNSDTVELNRLIAVVENLLGRKAKIEEFASQPGDVQQTYADVTKAKRLLNYQPTTSIEEGMSRFVRWYLESRG